jgi:choice-of-anchor A domain-containing protein
MMRFLGRLLVVGTVLAGVAQASAGTLTATDILKQFNVVTTGNLSTNSDIEGRTVVGGNLTGGATFYNNPGGAAASNFRALTVYGNSTVGNPININNGGGATIQGMAAGLINLNGGGEKSVNGAPAAPLPNFSSTFTAPLQSLVTTLAGMVANSVLPGASTPGFPNNVPIKASAGTGLAVFSITTADLAKYASFSIDLNGRDGAVFNVTGGSYTGMANFLNATSVASKVIWNFTDATSLDFQRQWGGTVLARNAAVTNSTPIEGSLFAASYNGRGELHSRPFSATLPAGATEVPEPAGLTLLLAGIFGLVWARRRAAQAA